MQCAVDIGRYVLCTVQIVYLFLTNIAFRWHPERRVNYNETPYLNDFDFLVQDTERTVEDEVFDSRKIIFKKH